MPSMLRLGFGVLQMKQRALHLQRHAFFEWFSTFFEWFSTRTLSARVQATSTLHEQLHLQAFTFVQSKCKKQRTEKTVPIFE